MARDSSKRSPDLGVVRVETAYGTKVYALEHHTGVLLVNGKRAAHPHTGYPIPRHAAERYMVAARQSALLWEGR